MIKLIYIDDTTDEKFIVAKIMTNHSVSVIDALAISGVDMAKDMRQCMR